MNNQKNKKWELHLDDYERNNLLWLLEAIGGGFYINNNKLKSIEPFSLANTGDWLGQIIYKLKGDEIRRGQSNLTHEELREAIKNWLERKTALTIIKTIDTSSGDKGKG